MAKKHISNEERRELAWDETKAKNREDIDRMLAFLKLDFNEFDIEYSTKCKLLMLGDFYGRDLKKVLARAKSHSEEL
ncbi:hypothetical protein [Butyrivibrio sp. LC3010]|uniref:hypothetical protein n=1 Tax=Butyrivibrio sp. LC3010 TaxID=1280680 RepID=UPI000426B2E5|nr:hypothetical protein [Butyrivibrio sp. LC3010]